MDYEGIVINKCYINKLSELENDIGWKLTEDIDEEYNFGNCEKVNTSGCYIYYTEKGTLLFTGEDILEDNIFNGVTNANALMFGEYGTSGITAFLYYEGNKLRRKRFAENDETVEEFGEKLDIEINVGDNSFFVFELIEQWLGKPYGAIEDNERVISYSYRSNSAKKTIEVPRSELNKENKAEELEPYDPDKAFENYKWDDIENSNKSENIQKDLEVINKTRWWEFWK